jgi:predicted RNA binding protein YcfA (HicA-like mRNA interferase family)
MNPRKLLRKILAGTETVRFDDFVRLVTAFGFCLDRVRGSHHIFVHAQIDELLNVQDSHGEAKRYQIRQFLKLVEKYHLTIGDSQK